MQVMVGKIKKLLKLILTILKLNLIREMQYRFNFFTTLFIQGSVSIVNILFYDIIYSHVNYIGTWDRHHTMMLVGSFIFVNCFNMATSFHNITEIPDMILKGRLDTYLLKPYSSRFLVCFRTFDFGSFINAIIGIVLVVISIIHVKNPISSINFLIFLLCIFMGSFLLHNSLFLLMILAFWVGQCRQLSDWFSLLMEFGNKPKSIFPKIVQIICYFIFPIFMMAIIPVEYLLGRQQPVLLIFFIIFFLLYYLFSRWVWKIGLKKYSSASN